MLSVRVSLKLFSLRSFATTAKRASVSIVEAPNLKFQIPNLKLETLSAKRKTLSEKLKFQKDTLKRSLWSYGTQIHHFRIGIRICDGCFLLWWILLLAIMPSDSS